jgi:steroid delta-isomerase-like uncharacterized protein
MTSTTVGQNLVKRQIEAWNNHDPERFASGYAPDATVLDPGYPEPLSGRDAVVKDAVAFFKAFPDLEFRVTKVLEDGNTLAFEGMAAGTHKGTLELPTGPVPATGKRLEFSWAVFDDLSADGTIREERRYYDVLGQLTQLGIIQ